MAIEGIGKVCVIGAGTMGCQISLKCAVHGYEAVLYDISAEALQRAPARQKGIADRLISRGAFNQSQVDEALAHVTRTTDPAQAAKNADLLSESVPEIVELKRMIHAQFDQLCPPHTIMTTNSSTLLVSEIEGAVRRGDKFAALHFHTLLGSVVDIMQGPRTSDETVDTLKRFARSLGETPIVLKREKDGYVCNTMLLGLLQAASSLLIGGYADTEDIDRSWMAVYRFGAGPFGLMDNIGLDVVLNIAEAQVKRGKGEAWGPIVDFLRPYVERRDLGTKTGKGFYTYPNPTYLRPGFLSGQDS